MRYVVSVWYQSCLTRANSPPGAKVSGNELFKEQEFQSPIETFAPGSELACEWQWQGKVR